MARAIGATAISRVMRSVSTADRTASRSKRRWSRTDDPAHTEASRLSSPSMWNGGVAIWNRSSAVRPSADPQMTMAAPMLEWVWRTALGMPVVPELNTSTASVWSQSSSTDMGSAEVSARAATAGSSSRRTTRSAS